MSYQHNGVFHVQAGRSCILGSGPFGSENQSKKGKRRQAECSRTGRPCRWFIVSTYQERCTNGGAKDCAERASSKAVKQNFIIMVIADVKIVDVGGQGDDKINRHDEIRF
mmetsp:Transcript_10341/g.23002  ORF Transcript_10341/g.23002 Transcript_10341/m.23002 type:complete len:110 (+) Transcript_10341:1894-2223(+)